MNAPPEPSNEPLMEMLEWLAHRLGVAHEAAWPALLRVRAPSGLVVPEVHLSAVFAPGGQRLDKSVVTPAGLCMIDWPLRAKRVELEVQWEGARAKVEVERARPMPEMVIEVRLCGG